MKPKDKPKIVVLTQFDIALAEFKNENHYKHWLRVCGHKKNIAKILRGKAIGHIAYLPLF